MKIYHGSKFIIEKPEPGKGSPFNDYGLGFYCTEHTELAKEWACTNEHGGYANKYSLDTNNLKILKLNGPDHHILNWLAILLENRQFDAGTEVKRSAKDYIISGFLPDYKSAVVITGYRADDSYFSFANAFLSNGISLQQLARAMYLGDLGEQIVLKSSKAFSHLSFEGYEIADRSEFFLKRKQRDDRAREIYKEQIKNSAALANDIFMIDIIRQGWRNDDVRI